jgi:hypothetical protein
MSKVRPITPDELDEAVLEYLPDRVIDSINKLIIKKSKNGVSTFTYPELKDAICAGIEMRQHEAEALGYFNFKRIYENAGWVVAVETPEWGEGGSTQYTLSKRQRSPHPRIHSPVGS